MGCTRLWLFDGFLPVKPNHFDRFKLWKSCLSEMGLKASVRQLLKRVIGESSYGTLRHALRDGPDSVLRGGRPSSPTLSSHATPFLERFTGSTAAPTQLSGTQRKITESEAVENSPICCNKFLATDTLQINYVSKTGQSSSRTVSYTHLTLPTILRV